MFLKEDEEPDLTDVADLEREDGFSLGTLSLKVKCPPRGPFILFTYIII